MTHAMLVKIYWVRAWFITDTKWIMTDQSMQFSEWNKDVLIMKTGVLKKETLLFMLRQSILCFHDDCIQTHAVLLTGFKHRKGDNTELYGWRFWCTAAVSVTLSIAYQGLACMAVIILTDLLHRAWWWLGVKVWLDVGHNPAAHRCNLGNGCLDVPLCDNKMMYISAPTRMRR